MLKFPKAEILLVIVRGASGPNISLFVDFETSLASTTDIVY